MPKTTKKRKIRWDFIVYGVIVVLAIVLRFARYNERWALAYDQARDAIIAQEVLNGKPMPAIGPFSSAGNFTTGPIWYWFVVAATAIYPHAILTPWIVLTTLYVAQVILLMATGYVIGGRALAIILGLFAAVSPAQIEQGLNLTNPSLVSIFATIAVWAGITYLKSGSMKHLIILSLSIGCAFTTHYQAALLAVFGLIIPILRRPRWTHYVAFAILAALPLIPLVHFDMTHGYYNYRGIIDYLKFGQYNVYIPNRWLTYLGVFIPHLWSGIIGGINPVTILLVGVMALSFAIAIFARLFTPYSVSIFASLAIMIGALRFYRGERFESYFVFLHPFILTVSAWALWIIYNKQKIIGALFVAVVTVSSLSVVIPSILAAKNWTAWRAGQWIATLSKQYPGEQFDVYSYKSQGDTHSLALVLYLSHAQKISSTGHKIGFGALPYTLASQSRPVPENTGGLDLWDMASSSAMKISQDDWDNINPDSLYRNVVVWYSSPRP